MLHRSRRLVPAIVLGTLGLGAVAMAADTATEDLRGQISALQAKVDALEAKQISAQDVDATVRQVLNDAETRSQLMAAEGFTAGYNKGKFLVQSADGNFVLNPALQFQARYVGNYQDGGLNADSAYNDGFEIRRMKLGFSGNAISPDLTYNFVWTTLNGTGDGTGGNLSLEDAWARYKFAPDFAVFGGQFKDFFMHEGNVSSKRYLAVDYSLLDLALGNDGNTKYVQGVGLAWETQQVRASIAYHDGGASQNTYFADYNGVKWGITGRAEAMLQGDKWAQYDDFTALGNKSDLLVLGAGFDLTQRAGSNVLFHAADVQWEPQSIAGLSVYGAYVATWTDNTVVDTVNTYNYGFLAQAGYLLNDKLEVFGRYDIIFRDDNGLEGEVDPVQEFTVGMNYYINGHNAKFTADLGFLPEGTGGVASTSGLNAIGYGATDSTSRDPQIVARIQFQLLL